MTSAPRRSCVVAMAIALATLGGCQQFSSPGRLVLPPSQTAWLDKTLSWPEPADAESLRPEQKADIQVAMAHGLTLQGRTDDAKKLYREVITTAPQRADAYHLLALLHDRNGECQAAEKYYQEALQRAPANAEMHSDFGYNCYLRQRWQEAETHLRQALMLQPDLGRAHNNLGLLLARTGREAEALKEFARTGSSPAEAHANLAYVYTLTDRWNEAEAAFGQALALDPNAKSAREGLAKLRSVAAKRNANGAKTR